MSTREQDIFVFPQRKEQYQPEDPAGDYFTDPYGQHEIRDGALKLVDVGKNIGNDQRICDNGRQGSKNLVKCRFLLRRQSGFGGLCSFPACFTDSISAQCADQRCKGAKNNIQRQTAGQDITEDASHKKPAETRMGSGKGTLEYWVAVVKPGRVMFEISGVAEDVAKEALRLATHKLPCKCKIVSKADLEGGAVNEN